MSSHSKHNLEILAAVERGDLVSQLDMAQRVGVAVGMVNALVKRAVRKGFVKVKAVPPRRYSYYLTPKGFAEKSRLVGEYVDASLEFYRNARAQYSILITRAHNLGFRRFVIAGNGELVEIALLAAIDQSAEVVAIVDPGSQRRTKLGRAARRHIKDCSQFDAVIVAESANAQSVYDKLIEELGVEKVLAPPLICVLKSEKRLPRAKAELAK